ncbi:MAG: ThiF family adenylyltransferase [Planctomycetes bacterium]|nr:ThiF family adenylyltransferase [Planctomycetota bacterium]
MACDPADDSGDQRNRWAPRKAFSRRRREARSRGARHFRSERPKGASVSDPRYARQALFAPLGQEGQRRLSAARAALVGCGALGTHLAEQLGRAGLGFLRICDRDFVELDNLPRQVLFDEKDAADRLPKSVAAAEKLRRINSALQVDSRIVDVTAANVEALIEDVDLVLDGTDNFETRFLLNDACMKLGTPWVHGGCVGSYGQVMAILPGDTACLRCWLEHLPPPGSGPTCDTAGVLGPAVGVIAALQAAEALKILAGRRDAVHRGTHTIDVWTNIHQTIGAKRNPDCPSCGRKTFEFLAVRAGSLAMTLCGRDAVHISPAAPARLDLADLERRWAALGRTSRNPYLARLEADGCELSVFSDGRAIIKGTEDPARAKTLYSKYVGA